MSASSSSRGRDSVSKTDTIRVIVGDGSRVDRDLVRFMLERDGFRVISSVAASEDLTRAASVMQPDAVVLGEELLDVRGAEAARLVRHACPEAKIVLFSALPAAAAVGPGEPDAVLERGIGLKDLTPALNELFEPVGAGVVATLPVARAAAPPSVRPAPARPATRPAAPRGGDSRRRSVVVLTAAAAAMLLLVFAVARTFPGNDAATRAGASPSPSLGLGAEVTSPRPSAGSVGVGAAQAPNVAATTHVDAVRQTLDALTQAARGGSLSEVARLARELLSERGAAQAAGADVARLNELISSTLEPLSGSQYGSTLRLFLGSTLVPPPEASSSGSPASDNPNDSRPNPNPSDEGTVPQPPPPAGSGSETGGPAPAPEPSDESPSPIGDAAGPGDGDATTGPDDPSSDSGDSGDSGDDGAAQASRTAGGSGHGGSMPQAPASNADATPPEPREHQGSIEEEPSAPEPGDDDASLDNVG
jgi:hypothetical protein